MSLDAAANQLKADSVPLGISRDGREILFYTTEALVPDSAQGFYIRDRRDGDIELVSRSVSGQPMEIRARMQSCRPTDHAWGSAATAPTAA